jgi:hypothetical protein
MHAHRIIEFALRNRALFGEGLDSPEVGASGVEPGLLSGQESGAIGLLARNGGAVRLLTLFGRPVMLIFGEAYIGDRILSYRN